jgi:GntP family gluconate:H+ symporter
MFSGPLLFVALAVGIAFIVVATTRFKMHPFLALLLTAYGMGLCGGLSPSKTVAALTGGFGKTVGYIGIVIACGCIIGMVLEKSGCAIVMANAVLKLIGRTRSVLAMSCTGALVSIPVFCDSGYVILSPLTRSLARQTGVSLASFAVALSMGLYATHCLVPPTPGPIATAGELRADVGTVILLGLLVTLPILAATYAYAQFAGRRIFVNPDPNGRLEGTQEKAAGGPTYGAVAAFGPILFPVLLIALKSISDLPDGPWVTAPCGWSLDCSVIRTPRWYWVYFWSGLWCDTMVSRRSARGVATVCAMPAQSF